MGNKAPKPPFPLDERTPDEFYAQDAAVGRRKPAWVKIRIRPTAKAAETHWPGEPIDGAGAEVIVDIHDGNRFASESFSLLDLIDSLVPVVRRRTSRDIAEKSREFAAENAAEAARVSKRARKVVARG